MLSYIYEKKEHKSYKLAEKNDKIFEKLRDKFKV
jgi:hypothetical protein